MSVTTQKNYKATFILDLRETEDDAQAVLEGIKEMLASVGGEVVESEDLGLREFARAADQRFTRGHYLLLRFSGEGNVPAALREKLRLDRRVNRVFIEAE